MIFEGSDTSHCEKIEENFFQYSSSEFVFTGDTVFVAGCGRFFEGDASQMIENLRLFKNLPESTQVFCGH